MENYLINTDAQGEIALSGEICENTWLEVYTKLINVFNNSAQSQLVIDLSRVVKADSSALALIMELERQTKSQNKTVKVKNIPPFMAQLAKLYNLQK